MDELVQKSASLEQVIADHMAGMGGYAIAEKYGLDTEKVKQILNDANDSGKFIPEGQEIPVDSQVTRPEALKEGQNPDVKTETTKK